MRKRGGKKRRRGKRSAGRHAQRATKRHATFGESRAKSPGVYKFVQIRRCLFALLVFIEKFQVSAVLLRARRGDVSFLSQFVYSRETISIPFPPPDTLFPARFRSRHISGFNPTENILTLQRRAINQAIKETSTRQGGWIKRK